MKILIFIILMLFWNASTLASTEIQLNLLVWDTYAPKDKIEIFKKEMLEKHNLQVKVNLKTALSPHDFFESVRNRTVDIFSPTHNIINDIRFNFIKNNLLYKLDEKKIPNLKYIQTKFIKNEFITKKNTKGLYGIPFSHGPYSLLYDQTKFAKPPSSWEILKNSKYRIKMSQDHNEANLYIIALANKVKGNKLRNLKNYFNKEVKSSIQDIRKRASYWSGVPTESDFEHSDMVASWGFMHPSGKSNWKLLKAKEGITAWIDYLVIANHLKAKPLKLKIAHEWLNFTLSRDYQYDVVLKKLKSIPTNFLVKTPYNKSDLEYYYQNLILWPTLEIRTRNGLKKIWEE